MKNLETIHFIFFSLLFSFISIPNTSAYYVDGYVLHKTDHAPLAGAEIRIKNSVYKTKTDLNGYFKFPKTDIQEILELQNIAVPVIYNETIEMRLKEESLIRIFDMHGKLMFESKDSFFQCNMGHFNSGSYILLLQQNGITNKIKLVKKPGEILYNVSDAARNTSITLLIEKEGYINEVVNTALNKTLEIILIPENLDENTDYVHTVNDFEQYKKLTGNPLNNAFSNVSSMKFVYDIALDTIYFVNTKKHLAHYYFCRDALGYYYPAAVFNEHEYRYNPDRHYFLGSVDYFASSNKYMITFFASDDINCTDIKRVYDHILRNSYFGEDLYLLPNTLNREACNELPVYSLDSLYAGQNYQCLNPEESYGYLKKVPIEILEDIYIGKHDILLLDGIPLDIPVVSGIITTEFQPVLSHINVLSHNRGTPNMALRDGWTNSDVTNLVDELVYLKVNFQQFTLRKANLDEAEQFWKIKESKPEIVLEADYTIKELRDASEVRFHDVTFCGGKAANFGELTTINTSKGKPSIPQGAFVIPFHYYQQHIIKHKIDTFIVYMLSDDLFNNNSAVRANWLKELRKKIEKAPIDPEFYTLLKNKLGTYDFSNFRFRSSTNAEDIEDFNGAGLYESKSGDPNNPDKPVDEAVKEVWASLWNFAAFEEREYFKINQLSVAMGILVHQSFPDEVANGVAITKNIYTPSLQGITINCQFGEISVVNPEEGYLTEHLLFYDFDQSVDYIHLSNVPGMEHTKVLKLEEIKLLALYGRALEAHYQNMNIYKPLDIEFKIVMEDGQRTLFLKQCRIYPN